MASSKKNNFFETADGKEFEDALKGMVNDEAYCTKASFSANSEQYPDHLIPFVDKHIAYVRSHPKTDPWHYLSNLRLMTRINA